MNTNETMLSLILENFTSDSFSSSTLLKNSSQDQDHVLQTPTTRYLSVSSQIFITAFYVLGALGNIAALAFLFRSDSQPRNSRHALMLRCLASNDLVAVLGMLVLMHVQLYQPALAHSLVFCRLRVLWRIFGLGSGCVALVMAVDRWLALTRPFFYQKHVTTALVYKSIFSLWTAALLIVCLPFLGFGLYFEPHSAACVRYRVAHQPLDIAYAYLFLVFGSLLCVCIVWCNLAVTRALCHSVQSDKTVESDTLPRRISRNQSMNLNTCTREELAFGRLMALFCVVFLLCWMPQMISIPLAQIDPDSRSSLVFFRVADIMMLLHFILDPYLYVLQRWPLLRALCSSGRSPAASRPGTPIKN